MAVIVKSKTPLTVPDTVRRRAGFKPGDKLEFKASRGVVTILPKLGDGAADETLTASEARKVRNAIKQVREGKTKSWAQVKNELGL